MQALTSVGDLLDHLALKPSSLPSSPVADPAFPLRVPRSYAELIQPGNPHDPLLRQVLPVAAEHAELGKFRTDPVGDRAANTAPGLLHKYAGRVLLCPTGACAIHCRFCFRRHLRQDLSPAAGDLEGPMAHIAGDTSIREVILSGGDPLLLDNERLHGLLAGLAAITHVARVRVHSRLPVVLPSRVDSGLRRVLTETRLNTLVVVHANHAQELGAAARVALTGLRRAGVPVLNQSVLLRGVNDSAEQLARLSETLFEAGILPYYLHLLDRVEGAAHFEVDEEHAIRIIAQLRARLPGYLLPRLVREEPGRPAKTSVA